MKKVAVLLLLIGALFISSCSLDKQEQIDSAYKAFMFERYGSWQMETSDGKRIYTLAPKKDSYNVIWNLHMDNDEDWYNWLCMSADDRKSELRNIALTLFDFATNEKWDNNYHLYIEIENMDARISEVYDYESDRLYVSDVEPAYINMYERFGSVSIVKVAEQVDGQDFLIENELGKIRHNQFELVYPESPSVYISDGKLHRYNFPQ